MAEADAAATKLGVHVRLQLGLTNRRLFDTFEARVALGKVFRQYRPRLVFGFGEKTPLASPDHYQAMQITDAGMFYSRLTKWDQHFDGLPVHTIPAYLVLHTGVHIVRSSDGRGNDRGRHFRHVASEARIDPLLRNAIRREAGEAN